MDLNQNLFTRAQQRAFLIILICLASSSMFGCKKNETTLTGQVFVTTLDNNIIRLAGVEVKFISEEEATNFINPRINELQLEKAYKRWEQSSTECVAALDAAEFYFTNNTVNTGIGGIIQTASGHVYDQAEYDRLDNIAARLVTVTSSNRTVYDKLLPTAEIILKGFSPKILYHCETDADGKFSITYSSKDNLAVYVQAEAVIVGPIEKMCWLVKAPCGTKNAQLFLDNKNLFLQKRGTGLR